MTINYDIEAKDAEGKWVILKGGPHYKSRAVREAQAYHKDLKVPVRVMEVTTIVCALGSNSDEEQATTTTVIRKQIRCWWSPRSLRRSA